jgi:hypothetical protein
MAPDESRCLTKTLLPVFPAASRTKRICRSFWLSRRSWAAVCHGLRVGSVHDSGTTAAEELDQGPSTRVSVLVT